jgi:hypothetical protein
MARDKVFNVDLDVWAASHDPSVREYPASRFFITVNGSMLRIAFGQFGHPMNERGDLASPRFQVAVSMAPATALEIAKALQTFLPQAFPGLRIESPPPKERQEPE